MINPGAYLAKVVSHSIGETRKGDPQVIVTFSVDLPNAGHQKITYWGSFSEKALKYTIANLITCGLKGNNPAGDLELGKQVELVIDIEKDEQGKERNKVKFINRIGEARNIIPQDLAKAKLASLEGFVMAARSSMPTIKDDSDEIPF